MLLYEHSTLKRLGNFHSLSDDYKQSSKKNLIIYRPISLTLPISLNLLSNSLEENQQK